MNRRRLIGPPRHLSWHDRRPGSRQIELRQCRPRLV